MSKNCIVISLTDCLTDGEINGEFKEMYMKAITMCQCQTHADMVLVDIPTLDDIENQLCQAFMSLIDWNFGKGETNNENDAHYELDKFIQCHILVDGSGLFSLISELKNK